MQLPGSEHKEHQWSQVGASRNKDGRKYHACYCAADKKTEGSTVFITDYGTNYHGKLGCSKLKRTVHKVHKSEVDGKTCAVNVKEKEHDTAYHFTWNNQYN